VHGGTHVKPLEDILRSSKRLPKDTLQSAVLSALQQSTYGIPGAVGIQVRGKEAMERSTGVNRGGLGCVCCTQI